MHSDDEMQRVEEKLCISVMYAKDTERMKQGQRNYLSTMISMAPFPREGFHDQGEKPHFQKIDKQD